MERYVFPNKARAEAALDHLKQIMKTYGVVTRADVKTIHGTEPNDKDEDYGWITLDCAVIETDMIEMQHVLALPNALPIEIE
jgi:hypothetical protein